MLPDAFPPSVQKHIRKLVQQIQRTNHGIHGVRPPLAGRRHSYHALLRHAAACRGRPLVYPYMGSGAGRGAFVQLLDGSVKLDFITGIGVHFFGHGDAELLHAAIEGACSDIVMQGNLQMNRLPILVQDMLLHAVRGNSRLRHCLFATSGAMANENALKIIRQKRHPAKEIVAFEKCFAGRTSVMANITDNAAYKQGLPRYRDVHYLPFYRPDRPRHAVHRFADILKARRGKIAVLMVELIQGEGGFRTAPATFFRELFSVAARHRVPVWVDEVQTFGRTGDLFAFQRYRLGRRVDVVTFGKLAQICGTLFTPEMNPRPGLVAGTSIGSSAAFSACANILSRMQRGGYFGAHGRIRSLERDLVKRFRALRRTIPGCIHEVTVVGSMSAFTPFDGSVRIVKRILERLYDKGLMAFSCGRNPCRIRFLIPAGVVTTEELDVAFQIMHDVLCEERACI